MREVICLNMGQCGIQMANAAWELFCIEHGITADGLLNNTLNGFESTAFETFFHRSPAGQYVPRVVSADLEPTVLDEVRTGPYRQLFHPDTLISGEEDASGNFSRGHFTVGKKLIEPVMDQLRREIDNCEWLEGFMVFASYGGGTGTGFQTLVFDQLNQEFSKRLKVSVIIYPSGKLASSTVEPYNAVLTMHHTLDHADLAVLYENESIYKLCENTLDIPKPTFSNINRILAQVYSSMTVSLRFENVLNSDFDQLMTNLIPYPRIHYCLVNHAPILSPCRAHHEHLSTAELTKSMYDVSTMLCDSGLENSHYFSCCLQYRGNVSPREANNAVFCIKRRTDIKFVDWCPTGFKVGINSQPLAYVPNSGIAASQRSLTMVSNNSSVTDIFDKMNRKFDLLFSKRAFVHWFVGEGMEEGEFNEAFDTNLFLVNDYLEILNTGDEKDPSEEHVPSVEHIPNVELDENNILTKVNSKPSNESNRIKIEQSLNKTGSKQSGEKTTPGNNDSVKEHRSSVAKSNKSQRLSHKSSKSARPDDTEEIYEAEDQKENSNLSRHKFYVY